MENLDQILQDIMPVFSISEFLKINDEQKKVGVVYKDKDGNFVDKHIYHPKYGYNGMVTHDHTTVFMPNRQREYKSPTGERVILYNTLECLCNNNDGSFNTKDGIKVYAHDFMMHQSHTAETDADFEKVFIREYQKSPIKSRMFFVEHDLLKRFKDDYLTPIEQKFYKTHGRDIEIGHSFVRWLEGLTVETMPKSDDDILFDEMVIRQVYKYNGVIFNNIKEVDLDIALNNPEEFGNTIVIKKSGKFKMIGIIKKLEPIGKDEWVLKMLTSLGLTHREYQRKSNEFVKHIKFD